MLFNNLKFVLIIVTINAFTFFLFWLDKRRARQHGWRVAEHVLLGLSMIGGSPAAFYAMRVFRHKTRKTSFRVRYWLVVIIQLCTVMYWLVRPE